MDVTTQRRSLTTAAAGLLLGAVGAVGWSLSTIDSSVPQRSRTSTAVVRPAVPPEDEADIGDLASTLRRPLVDPPPPKPPSVAPKPFVPPPPKKTASLKLTLVGTIIESNKSVAIIADTSGKFDVKGVGESLELSPAGISVQRIDSEQVELEYQGKRSTVKLNKDAKPTIKNDRPGKNRRRDR